MKKEKSKFRKGKKFTKSFGKKADGKFVKGKTVEPIVEENTEKTGHLHEPVLKKEVIEFLNLKDKKLVLDLTLGMGGHSKLILEQLPKSGKVIGFDADPAHLEIAKENLKDYEKRVTFVNSNFENVGEELKKLKVKGVDAVLLDLGIASPHVDNAVRGFSFLREGPLDMRFSPDQRLTAGEIINKYSDKELIRIFREFGEEFRAKRVVEAIVNARRIKPIDTTIELADLVERVLGRFSHIHPATRIFQALRIEVNRELDVLQSVLSQVVPYMNPGARLVVISYHSLEDRIVKMFFKNMARDYINLPDDDITRKLDPQLSILTKKPIVPTAKELEFNPRSRSAKLRVAEKIGELNVLSSENFPEVSTVTAFEVEEGEESDVVKGEGGKKGKKGKKVISKIEEKAPSDNKKVIKKSNSNNKKEMKDSNKKNEKVSLKKSSDKKVAKSSKVVPVSNKKTAVPVVKKSSASKKSEKSLETKKGAEKKVLKKTVLKKSVGKNLAAKQVSEKKVATAVKSGSKVKGNSKGKGSSKGQATLKKVESKKVSKKNENKKNSEKGTVAMSSSNEKKVALLKRPSAVMGAVNKIKSIFKRK